MHPVSLGDQGLQIESWLIQIQIPTILLSKFCPIRIPTSKSDSNEKAMPIFDQFQLKSIDFDQIKIDLFFIKRMLKMLTKRLKMLK